MENQVGYALEHDEPYQLGFEGVSDVEDDVREESEHDGGCVLVSFDAATSRSRLSAM